MMKRLAVFATLAAAACSSGPPAPLTPVESVVLSESVTAPSLSAPVDLVRDQYGNPHIYGAVFPDVALAEGYVMCQDRLVQMDLARHQADGTLTELFGMSSKALLDSDVKIRLHHLRPTAAAAFAAMAASADPTDRIIVAGLTQFAAGVNLCLADLQGGKFSLPSQLAFLYVARTTKPWTEVDSLLLGGYELFLLSFDADSEIALSELDARAAMLFDQSMDPKLKARAGIGADLQLLAPVDATHTISGWTGMNGDATQARLPSVGSDLLALLAADRPSVIGVGNDHLLQPDRGSNNWAIGPALSASGHVLVANDTHLQLSNPPVFYLVHLKSGGANPIDAMGVQLAGAPGIALGMNRHVAWGGTVNNIDVTDVYRETIVSCDGSAAPCVMFQGKKVALVPRVESFGIGMYGKVSSTVTLTFYDVPHHGPIIPRVLNHKSLDALASTELSVRYTGHQPTRILPAFYGVFAAQTMQEAVASLDRDFGYGGQNWVVGDDQGHFGWTEVIRVPRRAAGFAPWKVMPGDGSAEWGADMDRRYIPHAFDPAAGFIATANNDPIGVTDDGDPFFDEPMVDGSPLYLGAIYDPGTRVGRVTARIKVGTDGGKKLALDDMGAIQSDAVSEYGQLLAPTLIDAAQALLEEIAASGTHPELTAILAQADPVTPPLVKPALGVLKSWSFDTPSGAKDENPTAAALDDSRATTVMSVWTSWVAAAALGDERTKIALGPDAFFDRKLLVQMCTHPEKLKSGLQPNGDSILWDDLTTPALESKRQIAAASLLAALHFIVGKLGADPAEWRWGRLHTLTLDFPAPMDALKIPLKTSRFSDGYPRHGTAGTVDVGGSSLSPTSYSYDHGPAIRFSCELDPAGPHGKNALPGGEVFDPGSPHYADQMELWRQNQTFDLAFTDGDVLKSAQVEYGARAIGRTRFSP